MGDSGCMHADTKPGFISVKLTSVCHRAHGFPSCHAMQFWTLLNCHVPSRRQSNAKLPYYYTYLLHITFALVYTLERPWHMLLLQLSCICLCTLIGRREPIDSWVTPTGSLGHAVGVTRVTHQEDRLHVNDATRHQAYSALS